MRLLIVSHTPHYLFGGTLVGWGATVREIDHLSEVFDEVVHIAPLHDGPPENAEAYRSPRVRVRTVPPAGGDRIYDKFAVLTKVPAYLRVIVHELREANVVHVRCPANISLVAIVLLMFIRRPRLRWVKYGGSWAPPYSDSLSYRFQRWWLNRNLHRGFVTVNGEWPQQPDYVRSFLNPCLTNDELLEGQLAASRKLLSSPFRLLYAGRLETAKGVGTILRIVARLRQMGLPISLDLVGDGPERRAFEQQAIDLDVHSVTNFHGWLSRSNLAELYGQTQILLLPSESEGWPKVVSEAMAYGVVPVASAVGSIPHYLERFGVGKALVLDDFEGYVTAIASYAANPGLWKQESVKAVAAARLFTFANYVLCVKRMLGMDTVVEPTSDTGINKADLGESNWRGSSVRTFQDFEEELRGPVLPRYQ